MEQQQITIVSGLPRSGTSMMMKMLEAGGIPPLTDEIRTPDPDNPRGYYEWERAKQLPKGDHDWLPQARGRAVKVISALLEFLPPLYSYKLIFMRREMGEILASQRKMLERRGEATSDDDATMAELFQRHLAAVEGWIAAQPNVQPLYVSYNGILADPTAEVARLDDFFGGALDRAAMIAVVDERLYRQRQ